MTRSKLRITGLLLALAMLAGACGDSDDEAAVDTPSVDTPASNGSNEEPEPNEAAATEEDAPPLVASVGSVFMGYAAWWIADGAELFEKHNVDVEVITYEGARTAMASMAAEQIDIMANSVGLGMTGVAQGLDVKFVYGLSDFNYLNMSVVSRIGVDSFEQIAEMSPDCVVSTTVPGAAPTGFTNQVIEAYDLQCEPVIGNGMPQVLTLVASGQADWGTVFPSQAQIAKDAGQVNILYDAFTATQEEGEQLIPNDFLFGGIITTADVVEEKQESLVRLIRALDEANQMIEDLSPEELAEITKGVGGGEPWLATPIEVIADQWQLAKGYHADGEVTQEEWQASLAGYQTYIQSEVIDPENPAMQFDAAVDMGPLEQARSEG